MRVEIPPHPDDDPNGPVGVIFYCDRCSGPIATTGERRDEFETAETHLHPLGCPRDQPESDLNRDELGLDTQEPGDDH